MEQALQTQDPLLALFSGKRRSERVPFVRPVQAHGAGGTFRGIVQDISEGGAFVEVDDPRFYGLCGGRSDGFTLVQKAFPDGFELWFDEEEVGLFAEVVRIAPIASGGIALGCRFAEPLDEVDALLLGVPACVTAEAGETKGRFELTPHSGRRLGLLAFGGRSGVLGPAFLGEVAGAGSRTLVGLSWPGLATPRRVATDVAGATLALEVRSGAKTLWQTGARPLSCRRTPSDAVELALHVDDDLPRAVRRHFRARVTTVA